MSKPASAAIDCTTWSASWPSMPLAFIPARSFTSSAAILFCERFMPIARRSSSASPPVKLATAMAMRRSCSWNSGTPSVRDRIGSRLGCV